MKKSEESLIVSEPTVAQKLFKEHEVITSRPDGMDYYVYKFLRDTQRYVMKRLFKRCPDRRLIGIIPGHQMYKTRRK